MTWPSVPFLYYGDEIGMRYLPELPSREGAYERTGTRTPMQWAVGAGAGFSTADEAEFYLPLDPDPARPDVASQQDNEDSLWHASRTLVHLRRQEAALRADAPCERLDQGEGYPLAYLRGTADDGIVVVIMASEGAAEFQVPADLALGECLAGRGARVEGQSVCLEGPAWGVWRVA